MDIKQFNQVIQSAATEVNNEQEDRTIKLDRCLVKIISGNRVPSILVVFKSLSSAGLFLHELYGELPEGWGFEFDVFWIFVFFYYFGDYT